jgi:uncharacterized protein (TIGR02118 family)
VIRVLVLYPRGDDKTFDLDYYLSNHMPLVGSSFPKMVKWEADAGAPDGPYFAAAHLYFDSIDDMNSSMASEGGGKVMADIANYTNIQPVVAIHTLAATS